jgi:tight adherence protein B
MTLLAAFLAAASAFLLVQAVANRNTPRRHRIRAQHRQARAPLAVRMQQAGIDISPARYRLTVAAAMAATFVVAYGVTSTVSVALAPAIAVGWAPGAFYRRRRDRRLAARVAAWPEAIRDVLSHLAVDATLHRALVQLGETGPVALRPVWASYARNAQVLEVPAALAQVRAELADPVSDHVIEAFEAAHDRGAKVAVEVLESLAEQVTRDLALVEEVITGQAEIRAEAVFAVVLPFVMLGFLVASNDAFARFYSRPIGWIVIAVGAAMAAGGWKLINTLGRIPTEPRLLARRSGANP